MIHENSQGTNYTADPRETFAIRCKPDYTFEWRGTQCGTELFDSLSTAINISVKKNWSGGSTVRPGQVTVVLTGSDGSSRSLVLSNANTWSGVFERVPLVTAQSTAITYTLHEVDVDGFTQTIIGNAASGYVITNTYVPPTRTVPVDVAWQGPYAEKYIPNSVKVHLKGSDGSDKVITVTKDTWAGSWKNVPLTDLDGRPITYVVEQEDVANFTWTVSGSVDSGFHLVDVCTICGHDTQATDDTRVVVRQGVL